jgi:hypothetical protein
LECRRAGPRISGRKVKPILGAGSETREQRSTFASAPIAAPRSGLRRMQHRISSPSLSALSATPHFRPRFGQATNNAAILGCDCPTRWSGASRQGHPCPFAVVDLPSAESKSVRTSRSATPTESCQGCSGDLECAARAATLHVHPPYLYAMGLSANDRRPAKLKSHEEHALGLDSAGGLPCGNPGVPDRDSLECPRRTSEPRV